MPDLPTGTVTLLFTDIEGSTNLLQRLGVEQYAIVLAEQRDLLRHVFHAFDGHVVDTQGDAFFVTFARATDAVSAAVAAQRALFTHTWPEGETVRVRMGLHTGEPVLATEGYVGLDVHRAARIMSAGHGGQVLLSQTIHELVEHTLPEGVALHDLGEHRLKDLQRASHLFQLVIVGLPAGFPPLKTLDASPNNLPVQPTAFLGREKEIAAALYLLMHENIHLLTLTGPGGTGKTRLALQVAAEASDHFKHGVFFVDLAPLSNPELVVPTIAQVLNITERGGQPLQESLKASLREKEMLLLLDNFEQVVLVAPAFADLLAACPKLKILVTSRMALHVRAEQEFAVSPLVLPDPKHLPDLVVLSQFEAVALFIQRAKAVKSDFQVTNATAPAVAEICVRLDGLPLAIELAATRIKLFSPQALLARLGKRLAVLTNGALDAPARQQTLRNTIEWSYQLLDAYEQRLFRLLSVFVGGCTYEAIEAVSTTLDTVSVAGKIFDGVASLIDKNLLQTAQEGEEPRLMMLETIREFGIEALAKSGEMETTRSAHAAYYLTLAEEADVWLWGAQLHTWLERLESEHDNLRSAQVWSLEQGPGEEAGQRKDTSLRFGGALHRFWFSRGHISEGLTFLERALAASAGFASANRAKALVVAADLAVVQGDNELGEFLADEALVLYRAIGDRLGIGRALGQIGRLAGIRNEYTTARSFLMESVVLFTELGNQWYLGWSLYALANLDAVQGERVKAHAHYKEALALFKGLGDREVSAIVLNTFAQLLYYFEGDLVTARSMCDEALMGNYDRARHLYEDLLPLAREVDDKIDIAFYLEQLAEVVAAQGEFVWSARLWGEAESLREAIASPLPTFFRTGYERAVAAARFHFGGQAFDIAWAEGRSMTLDQVLIAPGPAAVPTPPLEGHLSTSTGKPSPRYPAGLTAREVEVLHLVAQGLTDAQVAEQLVISPSRVNTHLTSIYNKLGVDSRAAATRFALEQNVV